MTHSLPALAKAAEPMSSPEVRAVAERAKTKIERRLAKRHTKVIEPSPFLTIIKAKFRLTGDNEVVCSHIVHMCCSLMRPRKFEDEEVTKIIAICSDETEERSRVRQSSG